MSLIFSALSLGFLVSYARACTSGGAQPSTRSTTTGLQAALGGNVRAEPFSSGANDEAVRVDTDLFCAAFDGTCKWKNVAGDQLDWTRGRGQADPQKFKFATGTDQLPQDPYAMLASNPRDPSETGILATDPINCQVGDGQLNFRHWISRANSEAQRPRLNVCWRYLGTTQLNDCKQVVGSPGPSTVVIPEILDGPFEVVLTGSNFVQSPQGGFIIVDDMNYVADIRDDCSTDYNEDEDDYDDGDDDIDDYDEGDEYDPDNYDGGDDYDEGDYDEDEDEDDGNEIDPFPVLSDEESCVLISCDFNLNDEFCTQNPVGDGSVGLGRDLGWQVTTGRENRANPLTGVKYDLERSRDGPFAVASFPDPRRSRIDPDTQYVLESPDLNFARDQYLRFYRYQATVGLQLKMCRDAAGFDCFWESDPLGAGSRRSSVEEALANREWREEVIQVPAGAYKMYTIAAYDDQNRFNSGQIGLTRFQMYRDRGARDPLC